MVRSDVRGTDLLLRDLKYSFEDLGEVLVAISIATLERLEAAVAAGPSFQPRDGRPVAQELLSLAQQFGHCDHETVHSAAWRLDAVRQGDRHQASLDIEQARSTASEDELLGGATALLAATVVLWARRTGQSTTAAASELCLAASLDSAA